MILSEVNTLRVTQSYFASSTGLVALGVALAFAVPSVAHAQSGPSDAPVIAQNGAELDSEEYDEDDTIVVFGRRLLGQVDSPQPPILELDAEEIAAYGSGSIAELLEALSPQTGSARGRGGGGPALLVNGVRISSFREMRNYPPEAIEKIEVFSEEVAQRYGFSPDQRVINIILKENFASRTVEVEYGQPAAGGFSTQEANATYLLINGPSRLNFNVEWDNRSLLTEAERGIEQTFPSDVAGDPDPAEYRSLVSDTASFGLSGNWTTRIDEVGNSLSLNAAYSRDDSLGLQGLNTAFLTDSLGNSVRRTLDAANPLESNRRAQNFALGSTLNLGLGDWQVTTTVDASHNYSRNLIDIFGDSSQFVTDAAAGLLAIDGSLGALADAGFDTAITKNDGITSLVTARGNPVYLPAGEVSLTFDAGYNWNRIQSRDTRNPGLETELKRGRLTSGFNLGVPLTSRDEDFGGAIGNVSLNLSAGLDHLSDFGTLYDWTAGLNWGLTDWLNLSASYISRDEAPSLGQLGNPEVATLNVPVFDLSRNETVLVTQVSGGNPNLPAQSQRDWKFGAQVALPLFDQASISFDYVRNHSEDVAGGLPVLTPEIEAAFPGRVTRDGFGQLIGLDRRAVTFAEQDVERIQIGINLSGQIGGSGNGQRRGGFGGGGPGGGGRPGGGGGGPPGGFRGPPPGALFGGGGPPSGGAPAGGPPSGDASANASAPSGAPAGAATAGGPPAGAGGPGGNFAAMRTLLCGENGDEAFKKLATGETVTTAEGQEVTLPSFMLDRIRDENGEVNEEMAGRIRERMCSNDGPPAGAGGRPTGGPPTGGAPAAGGEQASGAPQGGGAPAAGGQGGAAPQGGGGFGGFGRGPGGGGGGGGRWFFNLQYTRELQNETLIAFGGPLLDLLDGDALTGGGQARHRANMRVGVFYGGFGTFVTGNYTGSSSLQGSGLPGSTDLTFHDYAKVNIRMFVNLGQQESLIKKMPFLDNVRIGIAVDNIFDARQRVTDSAGDVPLRYQPLLIDPIGRRFEIEIRKMF